MYKHPPISNLFCAVMADLMLSGVDVEDISSGSFLIGRIAHKTRRITTYVGSDGGHVLLRANRAGDHLEVEITSYGVRSEFKVLPLETPVDGVVQVITDAVKDMVGAVTGAYEAVASLVDEQDALVARIAALEFRRDELRSQIHNTSMAFSKNFLTAKK